jgi:hypothetical protein
MNEPGALTDAEIRTELKKAKGERLQALKEEVETREELRSSMRGYDPTLTPFP